MYQYNPLGTINQSSLQFGAPNSYVDPLNVSFGSEPAATPMASAPGFSLGMNAPTLQMGLSGLNSLGNLWGAFQANKLAKDQLNFTKSITNTNLNNSIQSYNTALGDRARARGVTEGRSEDEVQNYVSANRLSR